MVTKITPGNRRKISIVKTLSKLSNERGRQIKQRKRILTSNGRALAVPLAAPMPRKRRVMTTDPKDSTEDSTQRGSLEPQTHQVS